MRPTPIPTDEIWENCTRVVMSAPDGDLLNEEIEPCEALKGIVEMSGGPVPFHAMRLMLDPGDIEKLQAGEPLWLVIMIPFLPPFSIAFLDQIQPESYDVEGDGDVVQEPPAGG